MTIAIPCMNSFRVLSANYVNYNLITWNGFFSLHLYLTLIYLGWNEVPRVLLWLLQKYGIGIPLPLSEQVLTVAVQWIHVGPLLGREFDRALV